MLCYVILWYNIISYYNILCFKHIIHSIIFHYDILVISFITAPPVGAAQERFATWRSPSTRWPGACRGSSTSLLAEAGVPYDQARCVGRKNGGRCMENGENPGDLEVWNMFYDFSIQLGMEKIIPTDFQSIIFQRGRLKPPTSININHHHTIIITINISHIWIVYYQPRVGQPPTIILILVIWWFYLWFRDHWVIKHWGSNTLLRWWILSGEFVKKN